MMSLISGSPPKETIATPWPSPPAWQPWAQVPSPGRQRHLSRLLYSSASFPSTLSPLYGDMPTLNRDFFRRGDPVAPPPGGGNIPAREGALCPRDPRPSAPGVQSPRSPWWHSWCRCPGCVCPLQILFGVSSSHPEARALFMWHQFEPIVVSVRIPEFTPVVGRMVAPQDV